MFLIRGAPPAILTSTLKMAPEELDKVLSKFYAEVKKTDGDDYEPESLKIMQSSTERYLKEKVYPVSIVRSREFHNSQEILNVKAISLRQQGRGKRPNKSEWAKIQQAQL